MSCIFRSAFLLTLGGTMFSALAGNLYLVKSGDSLQTILNAAIPGDIIQIQAGATFTGNFVLPKKPGSGIIAIRSSGMWSLPEGKTVTPAMSVYMPKLVAPNADPALRTAAGAENYLISGLEITVAPGKYTWSMVSLGTGLETTLTDLPGNIYIDRCYIHGDPKVGGKRGVALNSRRAQVTNSWISDFKSTFQDTQAVGGYNGPGPFRIENNYLEASGENIMFGGAQVLIPGVVPSDIVIRKNRLTKPLSWRPGTPGYAGTAWMVKNHFELKNGQRVTFDSNILENCWASGQNGSSILLTVRTDNGFTSWAVVQDVSITNNIIRHVGVGITTLGRDDNGLGVTRRITIKNNLFEDIDHTKWGGTGSFLTMSHPTAGVVVEHNTVFASRYSFYFAVAAAPGFVYRNNISTSPFCGDSVGCGAMALKASPNSVVTGNLLIAAGPYPVPSGNWTLSSLAEVPFADMAGANYQLLPQSLYRSMSTDAVDPGANMNALPKF